MSGCREDFRVHHVGRLFTAQQGNQSVNRSVAHAMQTGCRDTRHVGRYQQIGAVEQRLFARQRLLVMHVQRGAAKMALAQRREHGSGINDRPT